MTYIITYKNKKDDETYTEFVEEFTNKNIRFVKSFSAQVDYLYMRALEILSTDVNSHYTTYYKKKRSGKLRRIDIPDEELKKYMREVNHYFVHNFKFLFPNFVYAYVPGKSTINAVTKHLGARCIMGFDIKDFFGSCTINVIMNSLSIIYPFCLMDLNKLETIVASCMIYYNDDYRLPQGAPTSPLFSNLAILPLDLKLWQDDPSYTRYADDIYYSTLPRAYKNFNEKRVVLSTCLKKYNFALNQDKCKCLLSNKTNVWVLGVSIGCYGPKIGSKKKQYLKAKLWSFLMDLKNGKMWSASELSKLLGLMSYYRCIEPSFIASIIEKYEKKTNVNFEASVKTILQSAR